MATIQRKNKTILNLKVVVIESLKTIIQLLFFLVFIISCDTHTSNEITESNYLKADDNIWESYDLRIKEIENLSLKLPNRKDSIRYLYKKLEQESLEKNINTAIKFANTKSGFQRIYMLRMHIDKKILQKALKKVSMKFKDSKYGKSLQSFIDFKQIKKGAQIYDFTVTNVKGEKLQFSSLTKNKNILLIYGGLECIGTNGRAYLHQLYQGTRGKNLEFIIYQPSSNLQELKASDKKHLSKYYFVSDFLGDHSPMKINYGAQTLPTSFLIDENGFVIISKEGIPDKEIKDLFIQSKKL